MVKPLGGFGSSVPPLASTVRKFPLIFGAPRRSSPLGLVERVVDGIAGHVLRGPPGWLWSMGWVNHHPIPTNSTTARVPRTARARSPGPAPLPRVEDRGGDGAHQDDRTPGDLEERAYVLGRLTDGEIVFESISPKVYDHWPPIRAQATTPLRAPAAEARPEDHDRQADEHDREQRQPDEHRVLPGGDRRPPVQGDRRRVHEQAQGEGQAQQGREYPSACGACSPASVRSSTLRSRRGCSSPL